MKPFFPAVVALVAGIVLGAWQPRGELLEMRGELDTLRAERARPCRTGAADSIRSILRADAPSLDTEESGKRDEGRPRPAALADDPEDPAQDELPTDPVPDDPERTPTEVAEAMGTALDARRAQALAALVEQGGLDDGELDAVNGTMEQMNRELKAEIDTFVAEAVAAGEVDRRDVMDFAAEALDIVIAADEGMRKALPADVYDAVDDSAVDPFSYVSGDTLEALTRLDGVTGPSFGE